VNIRKKIKKINISDFKPTPLHRIYLVINLLNFHLAKLNKSYDDLHDFFGCSI